MRFLVAVLLLAATVAQAKEPDDLLTNAARTHFQLGRELFKQGRYEAALREFETGYQMVPKPQFLLNMAQAHKRLGQLDQAAKLYERFLADAPPNDRDRADVKDLLDEVRAELARRGPPPPVAAPAPAPAVTVADAPPAPAALSPPAPPPSHTLTTPAVATAPSPRRRAGVIAGVTIGVIAGVALAVGLGVGLTAGADACRGVSTPCLDLQAR